MEKKLTFSEIILGKNTTDKFFYAGILTANSGIINLAKAMEQQRLAELNNQTER